MSYAQFIYAQFMPAVVGAMLAGSVLAGDPSPKPLPEPKDLPPNPSMPDPFTFFADGSKATTAGQWAVRRAELKSLIQQYSIGHLPPPPGNVVSTEVRTLPVLDGKATYRLIKLTFGPENACSLEVALFVPASSSPVPVFVNPRFQATPGGTPPASVNPTRAKADPKLVRCDPADEAVTLAPILSRGYAVATWNYQQAGEDHDDNRATGFFKHYPDYDWSTLAAWAWSASRVVDFVETVPQIDHAKIAIVGHSRLGKATLIAGAFDDRFALVVPNGSGCGGTGAWRFNGKSVDGSEGIAEITTRFPYWFHPRLKEFVGQVDRLPFDQHSLTALVAPRALLFEEARDDQWASMNAMVRTFQATKPVYGFLNAPEKIGLNVRPGKHELGPEDWAAILDFADARLKGLKVERSFDKVPTPEEIAAVRKPPKK